MASEYMTTRAHDFTEALATTLPQIQFQAYVPREAVAEFTDLYIFGFITVEVLVGGYKIESQSIANDFVHHLMNATQFFRRAWQGEEPRFYPPELQTIYESHRAGVSRFQRVV